MSVTVYFTPIRPGLLRSLVVGVAAGPRVVPGVRFLAVRSCFAASLCRALHGAVLPACHLARTPVRHADRWDAPAALGRAPQALPQWLQHAVLMNPTSDGDLVLLHAAEQRARRAARAGGADAVSWRRWAGGSLHRWRIQR